MTGTIIDFAEAKQRLRPLAPAWGSRRDLSITDLSLDERMFDAERLPFVSGLPAAFLEQGRGA